MANPTIVTNVTKLELDALISGALLEEGLQYNITDRGIRLTAISPTQFNPDGLRTMLCPSDYDLHTDPYGNKWIGVWNPSLTTSVNDLAIWGGLVWKNLTGVVGTKTSVFGLDLTNWITIPKATFSNHEYISMIFNVNYDIANDWVSKQEDNNGNIFGLDKASYEYWYASFGNNNLVDICDWNKATDGYNFYNNSSYFIFNNSNSGDIYNNSNNGDISENSNGGGIYKNTNLGGIYLNSNSGEIYSNNSGGSISNNSCNGDIYLNCNLDVISENTGNSIYNNSNSGQIHGNSNTDDISFNTNSGDIIHNSNYGKIFRNSNNGNIYSNSSAVVCDIKNNINNGNITGSWNANVTDTIVTKTGTA